MDTVVASVVVQLSVADSPLAIEAGFAENVTVGFTATGCDGAGGSVGAGRFFPQPAENREALRANTKMGCKDDFIAGVLLDTELPECCYQIQNATI
jgi:hypothetical protein